MSALDLDRLLEGARVPDWIGAFAVDPDAAVGDLLLGGASLGRLNAADPVMVLLSWLDAFERHPEFAAAVDAALARWVERFWGKPAPEEALGSASLTAVAWCRVGDLAAFSPALSETASALRPKLLSEPAFLRGLTEGRARDPESRAWLAVARHQTDRSLTAHWWRLCSLPVDQPWYHGALGIEGLRRLPPAPDRRGDFPPEVAEGLVRWADALASRVEERWLREEVARDEFHRQAELLRIAFPFLER